MRGLTEMIFKLILNLCKKMKDRANALFFSFVSCRVEGRKVGSTRFGVRIRDSGFGIRDSNIHIPRPIT